MDRTNAFYFAFSAVVLCLATYAVFLRRARKKGNQLVTSAGRTFRVVLAFLLLGASAFVTMTASPNLGLDLEGGAQITLEAQDAPNLEATAENTDRAVEVLRRRVDALGVAEPSLSRSGENRIIVELPGLEDPTEASEALGKTAQLTFHPVLGYAPPEGAENQQPDEDQPNNASDDQGENADGSNDQGENEPNQQGEDEQGSGNNNDSEDPGQDTGTDEEFDPSAEESVLPDEDGQPLTIGPAGMTGEEVTSASGQYEVQQGGWFVNINFTGSGGDVWAEMTGNAACSPEGDPQRRIAIVLDGEIISSPQVVQATCDVGHRGGTSTITGNFSQESASELSALVEGGALPLPVEVIEQRVVGPTLGDAAIEASALAAIIGISLTAVFIVVAYRLVGLMAFVALIGYAGMAYAALSALGATLTLPGLAGFVLAIGMAVDANVLIFERAREDYVDGNIGSLRNAVPSGFKKAISAIADSNITTLLAAILLFFLASGPVRGFGVTLTIGVLASMLSALVLSRALAEWLVSRRWVRNHPVASGLAKHGRVRLWLRERSPNLMRHSKQLLGASLIAIVIAGAGIAVRGLNFGIEFTGGRLVEVAPTETVDIDDARSAVADLGFPTAIVNESGTADDESISVRTPEMTDVEAREVIDAISELGGGGQLVRDELIGPSLGEELQRNALIALAVALAAQLTYLAVRFRWTLSAAAVLALFQNVIITVGLFAWLGKPVDGIFLAAILTIVGYTVNDTVVVFDRIRESWTRRPGEDFRELSNTAVLNTLPRSVNTGMSTLFPLFALFFLGGESLSDFALALIVGIFIGTYSSNLTATPLAVELETRNPAPPPPEKSEVTKGRREDPNYGAVV